MGTVPCFWKRSFTPTGYEEHTPGPPTGSAWDTPPDAAVWTGSTKPTGKPSKTSTSIHSSAMHANVCAAIPPLNRYRNSQVRGRSRSEEHTSELQSLRHL